MKLLGNRKSKRQKNSQRYNIQKRVREHRRRLKKEAKRQGLKKTKKKDPGIPNTWPFKAHMLQELELKKELREKELERKRMDAREKTKADQEQERQDRRQEQEQRAAERKAKRSEQIKQQQQHALQTLLATADVVLQTLDARDPQGCRCAAVEAWATEKNRRLIFVLTKCDLAPPAVVAKWLQVLGQVGPVVAVAAEAGREGVPDLLRMLGHEPGKAARGGATAAAAPTATEPHAVAATANRVGVMGYAGTGKMSLSRAIRREMRVPVRWLLESAVRLRPATASALLDAQTALHLALRGALPQGGITGAKDGSAGPLAVVQHFLERCDRQALLRRFRLPAFDGPEGFVQALVKHQNMKSKTGKELDLENGARRLLEDLALPPGCVCAPPEDCGAAAALWGAHAASRSVLEAVTQAQSSLLSSRLAGPTASILTMVSASMGSAVDLSAAIAAAETDADMAVDVGDEVEESASDEEGEEEELEGEEEESDDEMENDAQ